MFEPFGPPYSCTTAIAKSFQRSIIQTFSTATAAATAIQHGSTQIHKMQTKHQKGGKSTEWSNRDKMSKDKEHSETKTQSCFFFVEQSLLTPDSSVLPRMLLATGVERKDITKSSARANQVKEIQLVNLGRFKYMVYKRH